MSLRALATQVDERLADLYSARFIHEQYAQMAAEHIQRSSGQTREETRTGRFGPVRYGPWSGTFEEALAEVDAGDDYYARQSAASYRKHTAALAQIALETRELDAVWREEGRWRRAFLVINSNGHVHNGMDCSTCYPTTRYEWLTAYSAADETEIVEAAGEMACTVCYPSAPAEVLNRPANLVSKSRAEKDAAKAERERVKAEREAKRIAKAATLDGSPLMVPDTDGRRLERIDTEYAARREWNSAHDWIAYYRRDMADPVLTVRAEGRIDTLSARQDVIEEALALKHGISPAEMRAQLVAKAAKRRNQ